MKWSDGVAADRRRTWPTRSTGSSTATYEQTNYGNYVASITSVTATDDHTVVMKVKKPTPIMLHLDVYILPEHIWKNISEKEVKNYTNEPGPDTPSSGPARSC